MPTWSYGITTVPERFNTYLPTTLASLEKAGFDAPLLFVDGCKEADIPQHLRKYALTCRHLRARVAGNWILALSELYFRNPAAERFAIFQDDFITYRNLRSYLNKVKYAPKTYWNLYTHPENQGLCEGTRVRGWYDSNQRGRGAVALVFDTQTVIQLLSSHHLYDRAQDVHFGWRRIDGGVVVSLIKAGWKELVHNPTLVQHIGTQSSMMNSPHKQSTSFQGESFDALELLRHGDG